jgi:uncharacterized protein YkwD
LKRFTLGVIALALLAACDPGLDQRQHQPGSTVYRLSEGDVPRVQARMLDAVNTARRANGVGPLTLNAQLNAAASMHSRDMSAQARPWHFGSDGSSPLDRLARVGYTGLLVGEAISETFETETETLTAWMEQGPTRNVILDPRATEMGFAYHQEDNGKLWWTLVLGEATQAFAAR